MSARTIEDLVGALRGDLEAAKTAQQEAERRNRDMGGKLAEARYQIIGMRNRLDELETELARRDQLARLETLAAAMKPENAGGH